MEPKVAASTIAAVLVVAVAAPGPNPFCVVCGIYCAVWCFRQFARYFPRHMQTTAVTHKLAVQRLRAAGLNTDAERLDAWRNIDGTRGGWDGHVRGYMRHAVP